jgi:uncharacterized protein (TIGR00159 family)
MPKPELIDIVDIALVAILLYYIYKLLRRTVAINIFIGIAIIFVIWKVTEALHMKMLSSILGSMIGGGAIALIIVFQQEIRKFLLMIGSSNFTSKKSFIKQLKFLKSEASTSTHIEAITSACIDLSSTKTGALIVIERHTSLEFLQGTGDEMNIEINKPILKSIFYKNSPLHDGAIIIQNNKIIGTRIILPVSDKNIPKHYGLRHRAALGITEKTDALAIVVSEENGKITYVKDGKFIDVASLEKWKEAVLNDLE